MNRTTVQLEGPLKTQLKRLAHERKSSMTEILNEVLRYGLESLAARPKKSGAFEWITSDAKPREDFDPADRSYLDVMDKE